MNYRLCAVVFVVQIYLLLFWFVGKGAQFYEVESKFVVFVLKGDLSDRPLWESCPEAV